MVETTNKLKKFTILHSNDMHGDFLAEAKTGQGGLIGGLSLLSGYINQVRQTEKIHFMLFQVICFKVR
ncbi:MAG: 3'-nucleotidase [Microcystis panniformis WG22]|jgi:5'-nucleotidase|nr:3'-nucleotidase [Microcystis panniformis WG22]